MEWAFLEQSRLWSAEMYFNMSLNQNGSAISQRRIFEVLTWVENNKNTTTRRKIKGYNGLNTSTP